MLLLALELSTPHASLALLDGPRLLASAAWFEPQARHRELFDRLPEVLRQAGCGWPDLQVFAVGRGPGAFSGLRVAFMAARVAALPHGAVVHAVSSGEALAAQWWADHPDSAAPVTVVGDARRGMFWWGSFVREGAALRCMQPWALTAAAAWAAAVPAGSVVLTSQPERLTPLRDISPAGARWSEAVPQAVSVAHRTLARLEAGQLSEPLEPIYLHPPV